VSDQQEPLGQQEQMEQMVSLARGPRGAKGEKGDQGATGASRLPVVQARAIVYLFALNLALFIVLGAALFHYVHAYQAGQARDQAAQRKAGQVVERALCGTFGELALNKPPPGNPAQNPSRAYDQRQHAILAQVGPDLRCPAA
jgi:hypothetical protein